MNPFIDQFRDYSTEYLLERRSLGEEGLVPKAHEAIELLLIERGIPVPPLPKRPIHPSPIGNEPKRSVAARNSVLLVAALLAGSLGKALAHTWIGLVVIPAILIYFAVDWLHRHQLTDEERVREDNRKKAEEDGLTDLMEASADGDAQRVRELLAYGRSPNARSDIGSTALMYAARNNQLEIVDVLITAGADPALKTKKGSTARDVALKAGHIDVVARLDIALNRFKAV